jgi:hypothetical protein
MNEIKQATSQGEREREFLRKLDKLSQKNREAALTMWGFFIDGMAAQERLDATERPGA